MKKILAIILTVALILCVAGCATEKPTDYAGNRIIDFDSHNEFAVIVDSETGVNYIITTNFYGGGIAPRYHADGTLYVSEVE